MHEVALDAALLACFAAFDASRIGETCGLLVRASLQRLELLLGCGQLGLRVAEPLEAGVVVPCLEGQGDIAGAARGRGALLGLGLELDLRLGEVIGDDVIVAGSALRARVPALPQLLLCLRAREGLRRGLRRWDTLEDRSKLARALAGWQRECLLSLARSLDLGELVREHGAGGLELLRGTCDLLRVLRDLHEGLRASTGLRARRKLEGELSLPRDVRNSVSGARVALGKYGEGAAACLFLRKAATTSTVTDTMILDALDEGRDRRRRGSWSTHLWLRPRSWAGLDGAWALGLLDADHVLAPSLLHVEVANALRRLALGSAMSDDSATLAHATRLAPIDYHGYEDLGARVWALRRNVRPYDAWYVALAELLGAPLATMDIRLSQTTGPTCTFLTPGHRS